MDWLYLSNTLNFYRIVHFEKEEQNKKMFLKLSEWEEENV